MLRVTVLNDARGAIFKMEGKLTHEWVTEAEKAWIALSQSPQTQRLLVDLCGVSFVDDLGRELLGRMHSSGAKLIGSGPMTSALIEEICREDPSHGGSWIRTVLSLFALLALVALHPAVSLLMNRGQTATQEDAVVGTKECAVVVRQPVRLVSVAGYQYDGITVRKGIS